MKSTGIVRKVDELGRIVLPIELRRTLDISEKDTLEIFVEGASIVLKKYRATCILRQRPGYYHFQGKKYLPQMFAGTLLPPRLLRLTDARSSV